MTTVPDDLTFDAAGVARALSLESAHAFLVKRSRLVREHGFPRPLPMTPLRWSREAVADWIAHGVSSRTVQADHGDPALPRKRIGQGRVAASEEPRRSATIVAMEKRYVGRVA